MKSLKYIISLISGIMLISCAGIENSEPSGSNTFCRPELTFDFTINSSIARRASRPLESTDNWQKTTDVRIYVFYSADGSSDESFTYIHPELLNEENLSYDKVPYFQVSGFEKDDDEIWKSTNFENHSYAIRPQLPAGYYRFLAIGRDDDPDNSDLSINWKENATTWKDAIMLNSGKTPCVTEIFSGCAAEAGDEYYSTFELTGDDAINIDIELKRVVAGVLLYVKNIPEKSTAYYSFGSEIFKDKEYVVDEVAIVSNGWNHQADMATRRISGEFTADNSLFSATRLASISTDGLTAVEGYYTDKYFSGNFVFPMELLNNLSGNTSENGESLTALGKSLHLCYFHRGSDGALYPLRLIPIRIYRSEQEGVQSDVAAEASSVSADGFGFNIVANHLYCLGVRNAKEDDPIDLKEVMNDTPWVQIEICPQFEKLHEITIN